MQLPQLNTFYFSRTQKRGLIGGGGGNNFSLS
jgi:hypothetical protein